MVKKIDELIYPILDDHIGVQLWTLSELWKRQFDAEMVEQGHPYFAEACGNILRYVGPRGTPQSRIVAGVGHSKQAVQQLIDELVLQGVVERRADPADRRGKLVVLTQKGLLALHDAKRIKKKIERSYEGLIGAKKLVQITQLLDELTVALQKIS